MSSDSKRLNIHVFSLTSAGESLSIVLTQKLDQSLYSFAPNPYSFDHTTRKDLEATKITNHIPIAIKSNGGLSEVVHAVFTHLNEEKGQKSALIFICATGIAVRMIAPYIKDKLTDPAVIVIDDYGQFVISLLSGHVGMANTLTTIIADLLSKDYSAQPVITTATDARGVQGIETLMTLFKVPLEKNRRWIKHFNAAIAEDQTIGLLIDPLLRINFQRQGPWMCYETVQMLKQHVGPKIIFTVRTPNYWLRDISEKNITVLISKSLIMGTGCRKNLDFNHYYPEFQKALQHHDFTEEALITIGSIDLKANEKCIHQLAKKINATFQTFSKDALMPFDTLFEGSEFVKNKTGISSVAGPSAYCISHDDFTQNIFKKDKCTFSFGRIKL